MIDRLKVFLNRPLLRRKVLAIYKWLRRRILAYIASPPLALILSYMLKMRWGRAIFYYAYPSNSLLVTLHKREAYIVNTSDKFIGLATFIEEKPHEAPKLLEVISLLPKNHKKELIVDIGANIGIIGVHAVVNKHFKRCIAFEPEPNNFRLLKANVALNNVEEAFELKNLALSSNSGDVLEFEIHKDNHGGHRVRATKPDSKFDKEIKAMISVNGDRLDNFSEEFDKNTTLIWSDTQGFEGDILAGASNVIAKQIPLAIEFWPQGLKHLNGFDKLLQSLEGSPYEKIVDLKNPNVTIDFNSDNLVKIAENIVDDTDLLIF